MVDTQIPVSLAKFQDSIGVVTTRMKPAEWQIRQSKTSRSNRGGTLTDSGLDLETKILSASGRGRVFFLTSLFIELTTQRKADWKYTGIVVGVNT